MTTLRFGVVRRVAGIVTRVYFVYYLLGGAVSRFFGVLGGYILYSGWRSSLLGEDHPWVQWTCGTETTWNWLFDQRVAVDSALSRRVDFIHRVWTSGVV